MIEIGGVLRRRWIVVRVAESSSSCVCFLFGRDRFHNGPRRAHRNNSDLRPLQCQTRKVKWRQRKRPLGSEQVLTSLTARRGSHSRSGALSTQWSYVTPGSVTQWVGDS